MVYEHTVLMALEDVENALVTLANEASRRARVAAEVAADETSFALASVQYKACQWLRKSADKFRGFSGAVAGRRRCDARRVFFGELLLRLGSFGSKHL